MWQQNAPTQSQYKDNFIGSGNGIYLNTAAEGLLLKSAGSSLLEYVYDKSLGTQGRPNQFKKHEECRKVVGELLGAPYETISFLANASEAMSLIANSLNLKEGDEIITNDLEFPSGILSWLRLKEKLGINVKILRHQDWNIPEEFYTAAINDRTRVVFVSHVSYKNGLRVDIQRIAQLAHGVGALCIVDATQALGRIPVSVEGIDFLMSSPFKWLCSTHGLGIVYCNENLLHKLEPDRVGWWSVTEEFETGSLEEYQLKPDAVRMEVGMPNFPAIYSLHTAVSYLNNIGIPTIQRELEPVCMRLCEGMQELGLPILTPMEEEGHAGIFVFGHEKSQESVAELDRQNIHIWFRPGRIRVAVHLYNDMEDIEQLLKSIAPIIKNYS